MLILSISMNIHIINNYRINYFNDKINNTLEYTIKNMFWPCLYTALTTIVAFGSLIFSDIKPIIDFGYIMIISLIIYFYNIFYHTAHCLFTTYPKIKISQNFKFFNSFSKFFKISS